MSVAQNRIFPDPFLTDENGILCYSKTLKAEMLEEAYLNGIFPWPAEKSPILWFSPLERGVIDFDEIHIPKRLFRQIKKMKLNFAWNQDFRNVILQCSKVPRANQAGTWITKSMLKAYNELHEMGGAHSLSVIEDGQVVAGIYGVGSKNYFSAESMFGLKSNRSKVALLALCYILKKWGATWVDIQMLTSLTSQFGGKLISKEDFFERIQGSAPINFHQKFETQSFGEQIAKWAIEND